MSSSGPNQWLLGGVQVVCITDCWLCLAHCVAALIVLWCCNVHGACKTMEVPRWAGWLGEGLGGMLIRADEGQ